MKNYLLSSQYLKSLHHCKLIILHQFTIALLSLVALNTAAQNAGINATGATPDASAILDLNTGNSGQNKGFLPPQVALTDVSVAAPVLSPATGLVVYTTAAP